MGGNCDVNAVAAPIFLEMPAVTGKDREGLIHLIGQVQLWRESQCHIVLSGTHKRSYHFECHKVFSYLRIRALKAHGDAGAQTVTGQLLLELPAVFGNERDLFIHLIGQVELRGEPNFLLVIAGGHKAVLADKSGTD